KAGVMGRKGSRPNGNDAALLADVNGMAHGDAVVRAVRPNFAGSGMNLLGLDPPMIGELFEQPVARLAAGKRHRVADHVGLAACSSVCGLRTSGRVIVADRDIGGPDAEFLCRDLGENSEDAFANLRYASDDLRGAAVVDLHPGTGAVNAGRSRNTVPARRDAAPPSL